MIGTTMIREDKTARQLFDEVMANPARAKFGFGEKIAVVNVDFQNAYTRIDEFKTAYETDPRQIEYTNIISALAREKQMPVVWTHVAFADDASDAGVWGSRTDTPDSLQNIKYKSRRHAFDGLTGTNLFPRSDRRGQLIAQRGNRLKQHLCINLRHKLPHNFPPIGECDFHLYRLYDE